jgi:hypothetical protein
MDAATNFNFLVHCRPGQVLRTRGRGEATIGRIAVEDGLIHGEVRMYGPCVWRPDGLYRDAPSGAAGPLDLMPPATAPAEPRKTASLSEALDPANRPFCCD